MKRISTSIPGLLVLILIISGNITLNAQNTPVTLRSDVFIRHVMNVQNYVTRIALDRSTGDYYYSTGIGDIYKVRNIHAGVATDTLMFTSANHGISYVQGFAFYSGVMYVSGNNNSNTPYTTGLIVRGTNSGSTRTWSIVAQSVNYETSDHFDHLFSGMTINKTGDSILICSGSRGDHGEIQTRNGMFPNLRNKAITSLILQIPLNAQNLIIPDDTVTLDNLGLVYARGIRNTYDFAYNQYGELFGAENSGDRDMDDELNWLRKGRHYGFPWMMGNKYNPQQFAAYDPQNDHMINHQCTSWINGYFTNDLTFPSCANMQGFTLPCQNLGPDADHYRDTLNNTIVNASAMGESVYSFTAHRSPLGLVFDNDQAIGGGMSGDAFITGFTRGNMSLPGYSPILAELGDEGEDLLHLHMIKDNTNDNYKFITTRIAHGFNSPVDMEISGNKLYLIEVSFNGQGSLWEIEMPSATGLNERSSSKLGCFPNPANSMIRFYREESSTDEVIELFTNDGRRLTSVSFPKGQTTISFDASSLQAGMFYYRNGTSTGKFMVIK